MSIRRIALPGLLLALLAGSFAFAQSQTKNVTAPQPLRMTGRDDGSAKASIATPAPRSLPMSVAVTQSLAMTGRDLGRRSNVPATPTPHPLPYSVSAPNGLQMTGRDAGAPSRTR